MSLWAQIAPDLSDHWALRTGRLCPVIPQLSQRLARQWVLLCLWGLRVDFAFQWEVSRSCLVWPDPLEREEHYSAELPEPHGPEDQWPQACQLRVWHWGRWAAASVVTIPWRITGSHNQDSFFCSGVFFPWLWWSSFKNSFNFNLIHNCFDILPLYVSTFMEVSLFGLNLCRPFSMHLQMCVSILCVTQGMFLEEGFPFL